MNAEKEKLTIGVEAKGVPPALYEVEEEGLIQSVSFFLKRGYTICITK